MAELDALMGAGNVVEESKPGELTDDEKHTALFTVSKEGLDNSLGMSLSEFAAIVKEQPNASLKLDGRNWTPLLWAAFSGHPHIVQVLLADGQGTKYVNWLAESKEEGKDASTAKAVAVNSPLNWAAFKGHDAVVWLLLSAGFDVGDVDSCGNTALHLASSAGHTNTVLTLLTCGVHLNTSNWYGNTALDLATNATIRGLLQRLSEQDRCTATNIAFGPDQPLYMCTCCKKGFTEDASTASSVPASPASPWVKAVRYCSECMYKIQEAETQLQLALDPSVDPRPASPSGRASVAGRASPMRPLDLREDSKEEAQEETKGEGGEPLRAELGDVQAALAVVQDLQGNATLIADAEVVVARMQAANALEAEAAEVESKRPLRRRADTGALSAALQAAKAAAVGADVLAKAQATLEVALAEVRLLGAVTVCQNIKLATHAHDGDLSHLRDALKTLSDHGHTSDLISTGQSLRQRLDAEVNVSDGKDAVTEAVAEVDRRVGKYSTEDPTTLEFMPTMIEGEEPTRYPTKIQKGLDRLMEAVESLGKLVESAAEVGADEELLAGARLVAESGVVHHTAATEVEVERVAKFEAEAAKRARKNKKKGKKKK